MLTHSPERCYILLSVSLAPARPKILLIDDNRFGLLARQSILQDLGYEVAISESGAAGLERFQACTDEAPFDVVVTDYRMPGLRGDEVVRQIRALAPDMPVVILSGHVGTLALTAESTGADIVLEKGLREQHDLVCTILKLAPVKLAPKPPAQETESARPMRQAPLRRARGK